MKPRRITLPAIPKDWERDPMNRLPKVLLVWDDATTVSGWFSWTNLQKQSAMRVQTIGFLLPSSPDFIRMTPGISLDGDMADPWIIPRCWVTQCRILK